MGNTDEKLEAIHKIVEKTDAKVERIEEKVTSLQVESGISKENRKSCVRKHTLLHTIIILITTSAIGAIWAISQKWSEVSTRVASLSKDVEVIKSEQENKIGDRFGHRKGPVSLAPASSPDVDDVANVSDVD